MNLGFTIKNVGVWAVEVGKGRSSYDTRWTFPSDQPTRASLYYNALNTHSGYKKRLVDPNGVVVRRVLS